MKGKKKMKGMTNKEDEEKGSERKGMVSEIEGV